MVGEFNINILFVIVTVILGIGTIWGWKRGLLEGLIRMVSCILGIMVLVIVVKGIGSFLQGSIMSVVIAILLLLVISVIHKLVKFIIDKLLRSIPVGKLVDKLAGAALGFAETILVIWLAYLLIGSFDLFGLKQWVMEQTAQSRFLTLINSYLVLLLRQIL